MSRPAIILGLGLSLAPLGSYIAVTGRFDILPILFSVSVLFWVSGFDIIYALQDEEFDKAENLYSIPVKIGVKNSMVISKFLHFITLITLLFTGLIYDFGIYYFIGLLIFSFLLVYQHLIIKPNDLSKVNLAFFTTNGIASVIFGIFVIIDVLIK